MNVREGGGGSILWIPWRYISKYILSCENVKLKKSNVLWYKTPNSFIISVQKLITFCFHNKVHGTCIKQNR